MDRLVSYLRLRLAELDQLLRGEATEPGALTSRQLNVSARGLAIIAVALAMLYGACMGSFSLLKETPPELNDPYGPLFQLAASTVKTPALFLLTLLVTLPSLYVFNALVGSRLTLLEMTRLLTATMAVNVAVLASLGTIVLFFSVTTKSYPFVLLINVAAFSVAGVLGLLFLLQTLHRLTVGEQARRAQPVAPTLAADESPAHETSENDTPDEQSHSKSDLPPSALDMPTGQVLGGSTRSVFRCWIVLFSLVGAQMGWVLRPFVGSPDMAFTLFRERESNFFAAVVGALAKLFTGG